MNNKIIIESLSMDLFRVAMGCHRKSIKMADRFCQEALKRVSEIENSNIKPYFANVLKKIPKALAEKDLDRKAEDALMYSTICKNYSQKYL